MAQSNTEYIHQPLTDREQWLAQQIVGIAIAIHKTLGPGLLESVYEKVFVMSSPKGTFLTKSNALLRLCIMN